MKKYIIPVTEVIETEFAEFMDGNASLSGTGGTAGSPDGPALDENGSGTVPMGSKGSGSWNDTDW